MEAARSFLGNGGLIIDFDTKVASANKILKWFSIDYGGTEAFIKLLGSWNQLPQKLYWSCLPPLSHR
ncbi:hypothetical protein M0R45_036348 [Rubus argutus]|uniref:Uncharacterized protein n=1 Tax=Rubus argutus TaxID=59490 RepID=A0AAW1VZK3_RUBAR